MGDKSLERTLQGGQWHDQKCDGTNDYGRGHGYGSKVDLQLWLIDQKGSGTGLVKRGFSAGNLHNSNKGQNVATAIKEILKHDSAGPLQNVLLYLLFVCPWHASLLGHACVFLSTFCLKVQDDRENFQKYFSSSDFQELQRVCLSLKENLKPFTHASSGLPLYAVCQSNGTLYSALWNPEAIPLYVKWLQGNLNGIIQSLNLMSSEASSQWTSDKLQTAETAGPFRFGFVFKGSSWTSGSTFKSQLPSKISPLTNSGPGSLQSLQKSLENFSTGNPGATAGGVVTGLFGAGGLGAGAAYATNAFGFQNFITSLISSFLK
ncbi:secreted antigen 3 [Babesia divergens]|uniref:Secreted antigen 3 n=1 Tax=Babesia divergens TaxID=32595 RepID=A0AAD9GGA3_BABDI|nr:secreted antigen 3 [Babesia divergens]